MEPVEVEVLGGRRYRLLYTPGFVVGVAAGDELEIIDDAASGYYPRGGNLAVQLFSREPVQPFRDALEGAMRTRLAGTLDGGIARGLSFTIPLGTGFGAIEELFDAFVRSHPGTEWLYGNVYDPDTKAPLGWWNVPPSDA
jgi:hypothetical protein